MIINTPTMSFDILLLSIPTSFISPKSSLIKIAGTLKFKKLGSYDTSSNTKPRIAEVTSINQPIFFVFVGK